MGKPLVSIIIPSYNQGQFIRETIESCLCQDYRPIEVLVVDGASTDDTLAVLAEYDDVPEVSWISEPDSGPVEAVNKGFKLAKGEIGAIQSSDDYYLGKTVVSEVVKAFVEDSELGLVFGSTGSHEEDLQKPSKKFSLLKLFSRDIWVPQSSAFFILEYARKLGGWDERFPYCPDTELWFKLAINYKVKMIHKTFSVVRFHDGQRDKHTRKIYESYHRMVNESEWLKKVSFWERAALKAGAHQLVMIYDPGYSKFHFLKSRIKSVLYFPPIFLNEK